MNESYFRRNGASFRKSLLSRLFSPAGSGRDSPGTGEVIPEVLKKDLQICLPCEFASRAPNFKPNLIIY